MQAPWGRGRSPTPLTRGREGGQAQARPSFILGGRHVNVEEVGTEP